MKTPDMNPPGMPSLNGARRKKGKRENEFQSYYGRPVVKRAHWGWEVWSYFFIGGTGAGASIVTAASRLFGNDSPADRRIQRAGHYISLAAMLVSPVLLIMDLRYPKRFYNMLRVLKIRSPLSVGTYILLTNSLLAGLTGAKQTVRDGIFSTKSFPGNLTTLYPDEPLIGVQGVAAVGLGAYTGVLLGATATPMWATAMPVLGPLFLASGLSSGTAAIELVLALTSDTEHDDLARLDRVEVVAILTELSLIAAASRMVPPQSSKYITTGRWGKVFVGGSLLSGLLLPLLIKIVSLLSGRSSRVLTALTALLVMAGSFMLRLSIVEAGKESADDPEAYHAITRGAARPSQDYVDVTEAASDAEIPTSLPADA